MPPCKQPMLQKMLLSNNDKPIYFLNMPNVRVQVREVRQQPPPPQLQLLVRLIFLAWRSNCFSSKRQKQRLLCPSVLPDSC